MQIDVLTLFPEVLEPFFATSIIGRAQKAGAVRIECCNFRQFATDPHRSVDDKPFGGGPGMVLKCGPIFDAVDWLDQRRQVPATRVLLTPQGRRFDQNMAAEFAKQDRLLLICGHYGGFDERIRLGLNVREVSIGDYVLSGGEPAAMVLVDAVVRLLDGVLGDPQSAAKDSFSDGLLEFPQYTRPQEFRGMTVPEVLLSGHHAHVAAWRQQQRLLRTASRRPDLLADKNSAAPPEGKAGDAACEDDNNENGAA